MKQFSFSLLFICLCVLSAHSQNQETGKLKSTDLLISKFWDNWFISAGAGVTMYSGDYNADLGKHITPAINVAFGKWITPEFGVRMQYNGVSMKSTGDASYWYTGNETGLEQVKFGYHALHTDFMLNLTNVIGGYNPDRKYQLIPFFGWGLSHSQSKTYPDRKRNEFFAIAGLKNNLRVSNSVDVHLELSATAVSRRLAGHMIGGGFNFPLAATVGFTYHFGGKNARRWKSCGKSTYVDVGVYQNKINALDANNAKLLSENEALKEKANKVVAAPVTDPKVETKIEKVFIPVPMFFDLNKWEVTPREAASLRYVSEYIQQHPNAKFVIKGYADSQTGNAQINLQLSTKRAEAIIEVLINKYGINADQIEIDAKGGVPDLFQPSELNRVVLVDIKE